MGEFYSIMDLSILTEIEYKLNKTNENWIQKTKIVIYIYHCMKDMRKVFQSDDCGYMHFKSYFFHIYIVCESLYTHRPIFIYTCT